MTDLYTVFNALPVKFPFIQIPKPVSLLVLISSKYRWVCAYFLVQSAQNSEYQMIEKKLETAPTRNLLRLILIKKS